MSRTDLKEKLEKIEVLIEQNHYNEAILNCNSILEDFLKDSIKKKSLSLSTKDLETIKDHQDKTKSKIEQMTTGQLIGLSHSLKIYNPADKYFKPTYLNHINSIRNECIHNNYESSYYEALFIYSWLRQLLKESETFESRRFFNAYTLFKKSLEFLTIPDVLGQEIFTVVDKYRVEKGIKDKIYYKNIVVEEVSETIRSLLKENDLDEAVSLFQSIPMYNEEMDEHDIPEPILIIDELNGYLLDDERLGDANHFKIIDIYYKFLEEVGYLYIKYFNYKIEHLIKLKQFTEALQTIEEVIKKYPNDPVFFNLDTEIEADEIYGYYFLHKKAEFLIDREKIAEAKDLLENLLKNPLNANKDLTEYHLALLYQKDQNLPKALEFINKSLTVKSDIKKIALKINILILTSDFPSAKEMINQALEDHRENPVLLDLKSYLSDIIDATKIIKSD